MPRARGWRAEGRRVRCERWVWSCAVGDTPHPPSAAAALPLTATRCEPGCAGSDPPGPPCHGRPRPGRRARAEPGGAAIRRRCCGSGGPSCARIARRTAWSRTLAMLIRVVCPPAGRGRGRAGMGRCRRLRSDGAAPLPAGANSKEQIRFGGGARAFFAFFRAGRIRSAHFAAVGKAERGNVSKARSLVMVECWKDDLPAGRA